MTYQDYENSDILGHPIELYDIFDSNGNHYSRHTGARDTTINYLGRDYVFGNMERGEFGIGSETESDFLELKSYRGDLLAIQFTTQPIDSIVAINIYRQHEDNYITYWSGYLIAVSFDEDDIPTYRFESVICSSLRLGHRRCNMRTCPYVLYGTGCNVNQENYKVEGTITNISDLVITSAGFATEADGWFVGGKILVGTAWRLIKAHVTNTVTISRAFVSANIGDAFTAYAGCNHLPATCKDKFNNKLNYGGNEFLPSLNPFKVNIEY